MLEKIGQPGNERLSSPQMVTVEQVGRMLENGVEPVIAEIGVGLGATTLELCKLLNGQGKLHIFDFQEKVDELAEDLHQLGFKNVVAHGNTAKYWDSYHWSLMKLWNAVRTPVFDYVFLDGSHTLLHDLPAFFICDKLLKRSGLMELDDYEWSYGKSRAMKKIRSDYMTSEQENAPQIKMLVDTFVRDDDRYEPIIANRLYRKR